MKKETAFLKNTGRFIQKNIFKKMTVKANFKKMAKEKSILVIFKNELPKKNQAWWKNLNIVIAPKKLKKQIEDKNLNFMAIESLISSGSIQESSKLVEKLSYLTIADGSRLSKLINYQGYELWWIHYDRLMYKFCLPYTQYKYLLNYLKSFNKIYVYKAACPDLFYYFLNAYNKKCIIVKDLNIRSFFKKLFPIPFGVFLQFILTFVFLFWLKITQPKLMIWTSDRFSLSYDADFRLVNIYKELRRKKIPFVEFIRSQEPSQTILKHVFVRKRPVVYSAAVIFLVYYFARWFTKSKKEQLINLCISQKLEPEKHFHLLVATHYLRDFTGTILSIQILKKILKWIGIKTAIVNVGVNRTFHEILACKLLGIKVTGIQHGATTCHYLVSDFMPGFDGKVFLSVDKYGLWSDWWRKYYIAHSKAYKPEQLYVSGHMRSLEIKEVSSNQKDGLIKVLFVSEELADPSEVMPYLLTLLEEKDFSVRVKFRFYKDGFENWLQENNPNILKKIKIVRSNIHHAISESDVVVGCHSTGVLEALLQLKPFVVFKTEKWGDYFQIKSFNNEGYFFAEDPKELISYIKESPKTSKQVLIKLRNKFFGDPFKNGSKWVVEQAEEYLKA